MIFSIDSMTDKEIAECWDVACLRVQKQIDDANRGIKNASYSYGRADSLGVRSIGERRTHANYGTMAELIGSKCAKCEWPKVIDQYNGNNEPDLWVVYRGKLTRADCRGTRKNGLFIYRFRDKYKPNDILIAVENLPYGPEVMVGWSFFGNLTKVVKNHSEWDEGDHPGAPYYQVPFKHLSMDFSDFGDDFFDAWEVKDDLVNIQSFSTCGYYSPDV